jgi:pimeloyl-ACP methyl ester carboxylesterase
VRVAGVDGKAVIAVAIFHAKGNALLLLFIAPVMLVDLLYRLLDKRQSALLILTVARTDSRGVALRNATQRQHAAETSYSKGATRPGADEVQLDLLGDYKNNIALYPSFQEYFRTHKPPLLAVWGKNDPFFVPAGAEAFKRDNPRAVVRFFDTGHFALETHARDIAESIRDFLMPPVPK